jgi:hypothetical protein
MIIDNFRCLLTKQFKNFIQFLDCKIFTSLLLPLYYILIFCVFGGQTTFNFKKLNLILYFIVIISFMCLATNCVTNIDQSKRENKK